MKLSVIVPVFNEKATIVEILDRVRATGLDIELIVVDDGSTDGTRELLKRIEGKVDRLLLQPGNRGPPASPGPCRLASRVSRCTGCLRWTTCAATSVSERSASR